MNDHSGERMRKSVRWCVVWLAACWSSADGAALHVDDFQTGATTLGWAGGSAPTRVGAGGPAGEGDAFLRVSTATGGHLATFNDGDAWTGDFSVIGAVAVTADLMSPVTSAPLQMRLVLFGPTSTGDRWTSTNSQLVANDGIWRSYSFSLAGADLTRVLGTGTYAQLQASTLRIMLRYDPGTPDATGPALPSPGGILNLDNIALTAPPDLPGDFNGDGMVDGNDLNDATLGWKARFGVDLDGSDFLKWQRGYGSAGLTATASTAVPEPRTSLIIAALIGVAVLQSQLRPGRVDRL